MIKISIIVPFYNVKDDFFYECIDSILNQSYPNIEIILIDDGSTKKYNNIPNAVKVIKTEHSGVSHARNIGISSSNGDYILFVDSDDILCKDACDLFANALNKRDYDIIFSRNFIKNDITKTINYCSFETNKSIIDKSSLLKTIFIKNDTIFSSIDTPWAKLYKKDFLSNNNIRFNECLSNGEDGIFNYEVILNSNNMYYLNKPTYIYRENRYSVCKTFFNDLDIKFIRLIKEYEKLFEKYNINDKNFDVFVLRILDRLLRKYYSHLSIKDFNCKLYEYYSFFEKYYTIYYTELVDYYFKKDTHSIQKKYYY